MDFAILEDFLCEYCYGAHQASLQNVILENQFSAIPQFHEISPS